MLCFVGHRKQYLVGPSHSPAWMLFWLQNIFRNIGFLFFWKLALGKMLSSNEHFINVSIIRLLLFLCSVTLYYMYFILYYSCNTLLAIGKHMIKLHVAYEQ